MLAAVHPCKSRAPSQVRKAREASLFVKGAKLFNRIPRELRNLNHSKVDAFKSGLDEWLSHIPDQPTIPGRQRAVLTNSLLDQIVLHYPNFP
jgi:hypothetical protein